MEVKSMNYKLDPQESVQTSSPRQTKQPHSHGRRLIFHVILIGALAFAGIPLWRGFYDQKGGGQNQQKGKVFLTGPPLAYAINGKCKINDTLLPNKNLFGVS